MTWDGIVSTYHKRYSQDLGVDDQIHAYIQSRVLKMTLDSMSFDFRRGLPSEAEEATIPSALEENTSKLQA